MNVLERAINAIKYRGRWRELSVTPVIMSERVNVQRAGEDH